MLSTCTSFLVFDLLASGMVIAVGAMLFSFRKSKQVSWQMDGNERLMIRLSLLAVLAVLALLVFAFVWRIC